MEDFNKALCAILLKERCRLLHIICQMKEDQEASRERIPNLKFSKWLLDLQEPIICSLGDPIDSPSLSPLLEKLSPLTLSPILSEASSDADVHRTLTQSFITLGLSLDGSGLSKVLGSSPFAPIQQEALDRMFTSGTIASGPSTIVDAASLIPLKEKTTSLEEQLFQMDLEKITERCDQPPSKKRKIRESEIYSSKIINYYFLISCNVRRHTYSL